MTTLAQELPQKIARLERQFGSDNQYVKQLKQQLAAAQSGQTTKELWMAQATEFAPAKTPKNKQKKF